MDTKYTRRGREKNGGRSLNIFIWDRLVYTSVRYQFCHIFYYHLLFPQHGIYVVVYVQNFISRDYNFYEQRSNNTDT